MIARVCRMFGNKISRDRIFIIGKFHSSLFLSGILPTVVKSTRLPADSKKTEFVSKVKFRETHPRNLKDFGDVNAEKIVLTQSQLLWCKLALLREY